MTTRAELPPIRIAGTALADMLAHALEESPRECCGLLVGSRNHVEESVRTPNLESGMNRFLVDPAAHFALIKRLRGTGREIVGAYHSHPRSQAVPSRTDIAEAVSDDFLCVIVSLVDSARPATRAYRLRGAEVQEVTLREYDPKRADVGPPDRQ